MNKPRCGCSIGARLNVGFAAVLGLLLVTAVAAGIGLTSALTSFQEYRGLARDTNLVGRLQANMLTARVAVKAFVLTGSGEAVAEVHERMGHVDRFVARAQQEISDPERAAAVDRIFTEVEAYGAAFDEAVAIQSERDVLTRRLAEVGGTVVVALEDIMENASREDDAEGAFLAGMALEQALKMRLASMKLASHETQAWAEQAQEAAAATIEATGALVAHLKGTRHADAADRASETVAAYVSSLGAFAEVIEHKRAVVDGTLDVLGPEIAALAEDVKLSVKADQDTLGPRAVASVRTSLIAAVVVAVASLALGTVAARWLARSICGPLGQMTAAMQGLANGDLETVVPCRDAVDEMGAMSKAVQVFKDNALERRRLEAVERARVERVDDAIRRFDGEVGVALGEVDQATGQLDGAAHSMVSAAGQASSNVQAVAAAAEEMSASVNEISQQTGNSREVTGEAMQSVEAANRVVGELNETAQQITGIVDLISDIADQTNLLALNATIEAARAGDAGRGFAVVAHEVKTLAARTGQATSEIAGKIEAIRTGSDQTVRMIAEVSTVMGRIDGVATAIAGAIEEQSATTQSIAQNAQDAARGTENVVETIRGTEDTGTYRGQVSMVRASEAVGEQSLRLKERIQSFLDEIRAA